MSARLPHTLRRTAITSQTSFAAANIRNRQQVTARRSYAEAHYQERTRGHIPWYDDLRFWFDMPSIDRPNRLVLSVALTVPAAYYLVRSGPQEKPEWPKRPLVKGPEEGAKVSSEKQSQRDPVSAVLPGACGW